MPSHLGVRATLSALALAALLSGCTVLPGGTASGGTPSVEPTLAEPSTPLEMPSETPSETPSVTPSETVSESPSESPSVSPSATESASADPSASPGVTPSPGEAGTPGLVTVSPGAETALNATNAFHAEGWNEGMYQPATDRQQVNALSAIVNCEDGAQELEYRFNPGTRGKLVVDVAQDVLSDSSGNTLDFTAYSDGKQVANKAIAFKKKATLEANLPDVTVLRIVVKPKGKCTNSSTALITKAVVQG